MSVTPGLGAFNKDKVANKFGIQLKAKSSNKQSQQPLPSSIEKKIVNTETSTLIENKTIGDFRSQNASNGLKTKRNILNQTPLSKTPEPIKKSLDNSIKATSAVGLVSTRSHNERRNSLNINVNHSKSTNLVKSNESINCVSSSSSSFLSPSNIVLASKSSIPVERSSLTPVSTIDRRASLTLTNLRDIIPETSLIKQTSKSNRAKEIVSQLASVNQSNIPKTMTKTEAEIEHQKDQPLYKRQLSKTLDNLTPMTNKNKNHHENTSSSTAMLKR